MARGSGSESSTCARTRRSARPGRSGCCRSRRRNRSSCSTATSSPSADLGGLLDAHVAGGYRATIGTRRYLHTVPFGCVERDGDRVTRPRGEADPGARGQQRDLRPRPVGRGPCRPGRRVDTPDLIADLLAAGEPVGAFEIEDEWIDVGQREQLAAARGVAT